MLLWFQLICEFILSASLSLSQQTTNSNKACSQSIFSFETVERANEKNRGDLITVFSKKKGKKKTTEVIYVQWRRSLAIRKSKKPECLLQTPGVLPYMFITYTDCAAQRGPKCSPRDSNVMSVDKLMFNNRLHPSQVA